MGRQRVPLLRQLTILVTPPRRTEIAMVILSVPLPVRQTISVIPLLSIVTNMGILQVQVNQTQTISEPQEPITMILTVILQAHQEVTQTISELPKLPMRIREATHGDHRHHLLITLAPQTLSTIATTPVMTSGHGNFKIIQVMKKMVLTMLCMMALNANAQVYSYDTWTQLPTTDLYDTQTMNMALAHAEMRARVEARKQALFEHYTSQAIDAFRNSQWSSVIYFANQALDTSYYNGDIYYLRGYANEQLGDLRQAKKDYRKGKKYGCYQATAALQSLKTRKKRR